MKPDRIYVCAELRQMLRREPRGARAFCEQHNLWGTVDGAGFIAVSRQPNEPFPRALDGAELDELRQLLR